MKSAKIIHREIFTEYYKDGELIEPTQEQIRIDELFGTFGFEKKTLIFENVLKFVKYKTNKELEDIYHEVIKEYDGLVKNVYDIVIEKVDNKLNKFDNGGTIKSYWYNGLF
jgi:hypothetical protein